MPRAKKAPFQLSKATEAWNVLLFWVRSCSCVHWYGVSCGPHCLLSMFRACSERGLKLKAIASIAKAVHSLCLFFRTFILANCHEEGYIARPSTGRALLTVALYSSVRHLLPCFPWRWPCSWHWPSSTSLAVAAATRHGHFSSLPCLIADTAFPLSLFPLWNLDTAVERMMKERGLAKRWRVLLLVSWESGVFWILWLGCPILWGRSCAWEKVVAGRQFVLTVSPRNCGIACAFSLSLYVVCSLKQTVQLQWAPSVSREKVTNWPICLFKLCSRCQRECTGYFKVPTNTFYYCLHPSDKVTSQRKCVRTFLPKAADSFVGESSVFRGGEETTVM